MVPAPARIDIRDLLAREAIDIHFQPIVSGRQRAVIGVEALCRGRDCSGQIVSPAALFHAAAAHGLTRDLDQLCRRLAVEQFVPLLRTHPTLVVFINTLAATLAHDVAHPTTLVDVVQQAGVDPRNVAVELTEAERIDTALLRAAVEGYNRHGLLVAIDDVGVGYSNLDRIMVVKPDMLKADRALVQDLHGDVYKQGVFKALVMLSERIGGWPDCGRRGNARRRGGGTGVGCRYATRLFLWATAAGGCGRWFPRECGAPDRNRRVVPAVRGGALHVAAPAGAAAAHAGAPGRGPRSPYRPPDVRRRAAHLHQRASSDRFGVCGRCGGPPNQRHNYEPAPGCWAKNGDFRAPGARHRPRVERIRLSAGRRHHGGVPNAAVCAAADRPIVHHRLDHLLDAHHQRCIVCVHIAVGEPPTVAQG